MPLVQSGAITLDPESAIITQAQERDRFAELCFRSVGWIPDAPVMITMEVICLSCGDSGAYDATGLSLKLRALRDQFPAELAREKADSHIRESQQANMAASRQA
jgi:hypothetical protein